MVKCANCKFCVKMVSDIDGRKFFACRLKVKDLTIQDNFEKWFLFEKNIQVFEKIVEVQPLKNIKCPNYVPKSQKTE